MLSFKEERDDGLQDRIIVAKDGRETDGGEIFLEAEVIRAADGQGEPRVPNRLLIWETR